MSCWRESRRGGCNHYFEPLKPEGGQLVLLDASGAALILMSR